MRLLLLTEASNIFAQKFARVDAISKKMSAEERCATTATIGDDCRRRRLDDVEGDCYESEQKGVSSSCDGGSME